MTNFTELSAYFFVKTCFDLVSFAAVVWARHVTLPPPAQTTAAKETSFDPAEQNRDWIWILP